MKKPVPAGTPKWKLKLLYLIRHRKKWIGVSLFLILLGAVVGIDTDWEFDLDANATDFGLNVETFTLITSIIQVIISIVQMVLSLVGDKGGGKKSGGGGGGPTASYCVGADRLPIVDPTLAQKCCNGTTVKSPYPAGCPQAQNQAIRGPMQSAAANSARVESALSAAKNLQSGSRVSQAGGGAGPQVGAAIAGIGETGSGDSGGGSDPSAKNKIPKLPPLPGNAQPGATPGTAAGGAGSGGGMGGSVGSLASGGGGMGGLSSDTSAATAGGPSPEASAGPLVNINIASGSAARGGGGAGPGGKKGGFNPFNPFGQKDDAGGGNAKASETDFGASEARVATSASRDPEDYFQRIDISDGLFRVVGVRYERQQIGWMKEDAMIPNLKSAPAPKK